MHAGGAWCDRPKRLVWIFIPFIDSLSPSIIIQILLTDLHTFCWLLAGRTCLIMKTIHLWWWFPNFLWPNVYVFQCSDLMSRKLMLITIGAWRLQYGAPYAWFLRARSSVVILKLQQSSCASQLREARACRLRDRVGSRSRPLVVKQ